MTYNKDEERNLYIKQNNLTDSYIDKKIIYQYRNVIPQRKCIGTTLNGEQIFFEETQGSLLKRNYGKSENVTSWNLLISDGIKSEIITKNKFDEIIDIIRFTNDYTSLDLENFITKNCKRVNALETKTNERKRRSIWADDEEFKYIKEFIQKLRKELKKEK